MGRFEAAYPEVDIERPDYAHGKPWWHAHLEGRRIASDTELRGLLDQLEGLFSDDGGALEAPPSRRHEQRRAVLHRAATEPEARIWAGACASVLRDLEVADWWHVHVDPGDGGWLITVDYEPDGGYGAPGYRPLPHDERRAAPGATGETTDDTGLRAARPAAGSAARRGAGRPGRPAPQGTRCYLCADRVLGML